MSQQRRFINWKFVNVRQKAFYVKRMFTAMKMFQSGFTLLQAGKSHAFSMENKIIVR